MPGRGAPRRFIAMDSRDGGPELRATLLELVLRRLGFEKAPPADLEGLRAVYRAWCASVPFDNVRKTIALRTKPDIPLPGGHALEFFESWLADGTGGTCWPTSNALFELLRSLGFRAHRAAGCMRDLGIVNHATVRVTIEGGEWLADSSLLSNAPLPLGPGVYFQEDPVFEAKVEFTNGAHVVWSHAPPNTTYLPCRLVEDGTSHACYLARYEDSRVRSPFNQRLYARRNRPGEILVLVGRTRFSRTVEGVENRDLSPDQVCEVLHREIGLSKAIIDEWARSGSLAASFEPEGRSVTGGGRA
ncbi:MAG: arylamine N-acetyltransferase [Acidobacteriota bacterium]